MKNKIVQNPPQLEDGFRNALSLVAATFGPNGGNVSIAGTSQRLSFDDGLKALQNYEPVDPIENESVRRLLDAADMQHRSVGDGTSTTTILAASLYLKAMEQIKGGASRKQIIYAFKRSEQIVLEYLEENAMKVEPSDDRYIRDVATVAMHGDKYLGNLIGGLVSEIGKNGMISVEPGISDKVEVSKTTGYAWKNGVVDPKVFNTPGMATYGKTMVVIINDIINDIKTPFWNSVITLWRQEWEKNGTALTVVCQGATEAALAFFTNRSAGSTKLPFVCVKAPGKTAEQMTAMLSDLAEVTGATVYDTARGVMMNKSRDESNFDKKDFGWAEGIISTLGVTSIKLCEDIDYGLHGKIDVEANRAELTAVIQKELELGTINPDMAKMRLANLHGAIATIKMPFTSETEFNELKETIEDGYLCAISAFDGIAPGGGTMLVFACQDDLVDEMFASALYEPFKMVFPAESVWTAREVSNRIAEAGVFDSVAVLKSAIKSAMSVVIPLIGTTTWIVPDPNF